MEELCRDSLMWHQHWREYGQPHHDPVSELHHIRRARYHKAVRSVIKNSDKIRTEKMVKAIADNRTRDLFKKARKIKGRYNAKPGSVDGCTGDKTYQIYLGINTAIYIIMFLIISRKWKESVMRSMVDFLKI